AARGKQGRPRAPTCRPPFDARHERHSGRIQSPAPRAHVASRPTATLQSPIGGATRAPRLSSTTFYRPRLSPQTIKRYTLAQNPVCDRLRCERAERHDWTVDFTDDVVVRLSVFPSEPIREP